MDLRISHLHGSSSSISVREELKGEGDGATEEAFTEEGSSIHSIVFKKNKNIAVFERSNAMDDHHHNAY